MIISCVNYKGGVAKTTTAYHLASAAARRGIRPTLIDLDPQSNLTRMCGGRMVGAPTVGDLLGGMHNPTASLRQAKEYISFDNMTGGHIVPSSISLENVAVGLTQRNFGRLTALKSALKDEPANSLIIIDTPPNAGILTLNALVASTHVLICADPEEDAIAGVGRMVEIVGQIGQERGDAPAILGVLATRVDAIIGRHADGLAVLMGPMMPPLLGEIPKRAGRDAARQLAEAYAPIVDQILAEGGLIDAEVHNARLAA
jgi:chromosome partitioning protein